MISLQFFAILAVIVINAAVASPTDLVFPGVAFQRGPDTVNQLGFIPSASKGMLITISMTSPLNIAGKIGIRCNTSNEDFYWNNAIGVFRYGLVSTTSGSCTIWAFYSGSFVPQLDGAGCFSTSLPIEPPP